MQTAWLQQGLVSNLHVPQSAHHWLSGNDLSEWSVKNEWLKVIPDWAVYKKSKRNVDGNLNVNKNIEILY